MIDMPCENLQADGYRMVTNPEKNDNIFCLS